MRHICVFLLCFVTSQVFAQQDAPRAEVFGGYSYLHIDTQGVTGSTLVNACNEILGAGTCPPGSIQVHQGFNGWNAAAQFNVTRFFGIKGDFSGHYGTPVTISSQIQMLLQQAGVTGLPPSAHSYTYLFGPVVSQEIRRYKPFAHALFGANSIGTNLSGVSIGGLGIPGLTVSDTAFAMAFGGGVDVKLKDHISLRVGQFDYLFTKHDFSLGVPGVTTHQNNYRASVGIVFQIGGRSAQRSDRTQPRQGAPTSTPSGATSIRAMGVRVATVSDGVQITDVTPNSAAALAGLRTGDFINAVNGAQIKTVEQLANAVSGIAVGAKIRLGILIRGMWQSEATIVVGNP
ncbi:MAG: PDZ domain-containing protein [Terriglobales bacterium]